MRQRTREVLWRRFRAAREARRPAEEGARLLEQRFGVELCVGSAPWSWSSLSSLWGALMPLPDSAVLSNPHLTKIAPISSARGHGFAVYHDRHTRSPLGPDSLEICLERLSGVSRDYRVPIGRLHATVRHEVGHAVAVRLGLYDTLYREVPHSPWIFAGERRAFLERLFRGEEGPLVRLGELYLEQPAGRMRSMRGALTLLREEALKRGQRLPSQALLRHAGVRHLVANSRHPLPCYSRLRPHEVDRGHIYCYDTGYQRGFVLEARRHAGTRVSDYQFRTPNEWFAELYAVYYADCDEGRPPGSSLRRLSWRLQEIARWFDRNVGLERGLGPR